MKLFVSDIDGTLYWYDHKNNMGVSDSCRNYIHKWISLGNIFALATARTYLKRDDAIQDLKINVDYLGEMVPKSFITTTLQNLLLYHLHTF